MTNLITLAESFARAAHDGQFDKVGADYIHHPAAVAANVERLGGTATQIAAAWLHDVVEDTSVTADDLAEQFPAAIVEAVVAVTKVDGESTAGYFARVAANPDAVVVKVADLAHNTEPSRVAKLDAATRKRLAKKYEQAYAMLTEFAPESVRLLTQLEVDL
jgi:(p)ppGpp synthase/HD superfamily hydrolase